MIDIKTKIHDQYSIEFKVWFLKALDSRIDNFNMAMWIFIPRSLDINPSTYSKDAFYQDVKSNIRLITPSFPLDEIVSGPSIPFNELKKSIEIVKNEPSDSSVSNYEYNLKLFSSIVKSSLRDNTEKITTSEMSDVTFCNDYITNCREILDAFHSLRDSISSLDMSKMHMDSFRYADEFICHQIANHLLKCIFKLDSNSTDEFESIVDKMKALIKEIDSYRLSSGYPVIIPDDKKNNSTFIHRQASIKKFIERQLYLRVPKKKDGYLAEQLYYSLAAGMAMIFATVVAWLFQSTFGNLTWPLFIALIISYMMKDRIKELMRLYFLNKKGSKYYDNKAKISIRDQEIGYLKESMGFIHTSKIPNDILEIRHKSPLVGADRRIGEDNVILYKKAIQLDPESLEKKGDYNYPGINDIIRLQVNTFMHKMDNPTVESAYIDEEGQIHTISCERNYYINVILQYNYDEVVDYKRFRITINRNGIRDIDPISI